MTKYHKNVSVSSPDRDTRGGQLILSEVTIMAMPCHYLHQKIEDPGEDGNGKNAKALDRGQLCRIERFVRLTGPAGSDASTTLIEYGIDRESDVAIPSQSLSFVSWDMSDEGAYYLLAVRRTKVEGDRIQLVSISRDPATEDHDLHVILNDLCLTGAAAFDAKFRAKEAAGEDLVLCHSDGRWTIVNEDTAGEGSDVEE